MSFSMYTCYKDMMLNKNKFGASRLRKQSTRIRASLYWYHAGTTTAVSGLPV